MLYRLDEIMWYFYTLAASIAAGLAVGTLSGDYFAAALTTGFVGSFIFVIDEFVNRIKKAIKQKQCTCHHQSDSTTERQPHAGYRRVDQLPDS